MYRISFAFRDYRNAKKDLRYSRQNSRPLPTVFTFYENNRREFCRDAFTIVPRTHCSIRQILFS